MDAHPHFEAFLETTVNLKEWKLGQLDSRVQAIVNVLTADGVIGALYREHIPQGSWAHQTIINPVGNFDEFDADFLLHLEEHPDWAGDPCEYLRKVRSALNSSTTYNGKVTKKNRCVRVVYANSCHVDVVPHVTLADGRQVIINYDTMAFEDTNPAGFAGWMKERDDLTYGNLRKVIRLLKYLRDYKNTFDCKSVILTALVGGRVQSVNRSARYADIPTTLLSILEDLNSWLSWHTVMPLIHDPSCPGVSFNHRWDEAKFQNFKLMVAKYASWAREAYDAATDEAAHTAWQKLFGSEFVAIEVAAARQAIVASASSSRALPSRLRAPGEEFIEEQGYLLAPRCMARIDGRVLGMRGFRDPRIRQLPRVPLHHDLKFTLQTDTPPPFRVYWKVRNHGDAAEAAHDLRGKLMKGNQGPLIHVERSKYRGSHYVEAYVVKDNVVVASDHHEVRIG